MSREIFEDLFVLEMANNHWGQLDRGLKIVAEYAQVARFNNVRATLKLQLRDVDTFIHRAFRERTDLRYVKKTLATRMSRDDYATLVHSIRRAGLIPSASVFDEASVDLAVDLGLDFLKVASSDIKDWFLIERIARTKKPVIVSSGGSSLKDLDDIVHFFTTRNLQLALNHCVSLYPTEDPELELNQIDFLRHRYPELAIGFSTHECHDWATSIIIAYAKGARLFERHVDIELDGRPVSPYCSLPHQVDEWFKAWKRAKVMCGASSTSWRIPSEREVRYLDELVRGVYARRALPAGHVLSANDVYLAIPLQRGQISSREFIQDEVLTKPVETDAPIMIDAVDSPYARHESLRKLISDRGL